MTRPVAPGPDHLAGRDRLPARHARLGEVVVEGEQAEAVVQHDVAPGEEVVGHERHATGVHCEHGVPTGAAQS